MDYNQEILTKDLSSSHIATKYATRLCQRTKAKPTDNVMGIVWISTTYLDFIKNIKINNETWMYNYDNGTNCHP